MAYNPNNNINRLTIMKLLHTTACLVVAAFMVACSNEEPAPKPNLRPDLPGSTETHIRSVVHSGSIEGSYDWEFEYVDERLVGGKGSLYNPTSHEVEYTSQLTYTPDNVTIANSGDLQMNVTLDENNFIETLTVNKDEYRFFYADGRLIAWEKTLKDINFGAEALHARGAIEYKDGDIATITYSENNDDPTYYHCTPSSLYNTNGLLPETLSKQMGCFGFEHLYYAGLLGKATKHLVRAIQIDFPEEAKREDYQIEFSYSTNREEQTELCTYNINGEAASVNYTY